MGGFDCVADYGKKRIGECSAKKSLLHHERIEAGMLDQAGIVFDAKAAPGALRVVGKA